MNDPLLLNTLFKFLLAVSLGALMGLERDVSWQSKSDLKAIRNRSKAAAQKFSFIKRGIPAGTLGGVRTYVLISILGAVSGLGFSAGIEEIAWVVTGGLVLFVLLAYLLNYFDKNSLGLTTEISLILTYLLSLLLFATDLSPKLIIAIAVINAVILSMKDELRGLVSRFSREEILGTLKFILFTIVIYPLMPDRFFGLGDIPVLGEFFAKYFSADTLELTQIFNPAQVWAIVVLVLGLNFVGYFATKSFGKNKGLNAIGLLGGLVSSTLVTETMARQSRATRSEAAKNAFLSAAILANFTQFIRVLFIGGLLNPQLGASLLIPIGLMGLVLLIAVVVRNGFIQGWSKGKSSTPEALGLELKTPFAPVPALGFAVLYLTVITISKFALDFLGESGFILSGMVSAMVGLDAIIVTTATLSGNEIPIMLGMTVLVLSASVNLLVKVLFAAISGDPYFRVRITRIFLLTIFVGVLAMLFQIAV